MSSATSTSTSTSTSTPQYSMEIDPSRPAELQSESWNKMSSLYVNTAHHATNIYAQLGLDLCGIKEEVKQHPDKKDWKLLDVAAGTGAMTFDAAEFIHGKGTVTAIDFSPGMLQQIENRKATNPDKYGHITTAVMDGQALTLQDNTFDVAFSLFGLVFFPDTEKGLKEIYRVLKPGGTAVVMSYDTIETHDISSSIDEAQKMCGWKGGRPSGLYSLGDPTKFSNQLQAAGFKDYAIHLREHWWPFESYAPVITIAETGPPWADWYGSLTADERQKFRDALTTVLTRRWPSGKVRARSVTRIGVAKKTD